MTQWATAASDLKTRADRATGRRDEMSRRILETKTGIARLEAEDEVLRLVSELFRQMVDREVASGVRSIEHLLTEALHAVFNDQDLRVRADVDVQRGKVSVDLVTVQTRSDGMVIEGMSRDGFGGAVTTIQSILLRIVVLLRRGLKPILLLDETLPALNGNYVDNMGKFLRVLCKRIGIDVLLVTFNPDLVTAADTAYRIVERDGAAHFEAIA